MKQTKLWLGMIAMLLCNLLPIHAESVTVRFDDWTSTNHSHGSTSSKTYTFTTVGGGGLSFDWWVSSETNYDKLIVTLDGTTILEKSGSQSGTYNHAITQGEHTLVVKYTKDGSDSSGSDQARISNLITTTTITIDGLAYSTTGNTACVIGAIDTAEVVIPSNVTINDTVYLVTSIGSYAFHDCSSLTSITIPESVTSIGNYAFDNCTALKKVIIEDGNTTLSLGYNYYYSNGTGQGLFYDCPLEEVYLGRNLSYGSGSTYGYSPFYDKDALKKVTIGNEVTEIGQDAFRGCDNIHSLVMGNGVLSIGSNAFSTPEKVIWLTNTPPSGYINAKGSINYVANDQYTNLNNVQVYPYLSSMFEVDGVKYVPVSPSERTCHAIDCAYDSTATAINVGETASFKGVAMKVTEVMPYTFYGNDHIKEVSVSHLGNIGNYAFCDCDEIETVNVSNQGSIGSQAFYDCDGIETAIVDNYIPTAPSVDDTPLTFADWTSTNHSSSSTSSETYTFTAGEGATLSFSWSVSSEANFDELIVTLDGTTILEKSGSQSGTYSNTISEGSHTLVVKYTKDNSSSSGSDQASVTSITVSKGGATTLIAGVGNEAFSGCSSLKTVTLGDSIGSLGDKAFYQCHSLQEIAIPDHVKSVGAYCFSGCSAMTNVALGRKVATINNYAFQNCSSLPEITLPQAMTKVGDYVFSGCSKLADVIIEDRTTALALGSNGSSPLFVDCPLDSVYIGGKITYSTTSSKGYSPFYRNTSLRTVVITDREEQIYENEFYGCTNLKNVTIGNGVKSIGDYAFSGCSSLDGFSFGSNMESIGAEAFSDCTNLTTITSHAAVSPTCGTQALDDINKWSCTLRVPSGYAAAYLAADQWKEFFFVEDVVEVEKYILTYVVDGEVYHTDTLVHKATIVLPEAPTKEGYTFSGWSEAPETMPAEDVTISGTFTINKYLVTFKVGDEVIAADSLEYGATIVTPEAPEREGHTFNGWGEVATVVPANDLIYEGSYSVNSYLLTYMVDGEAVQSDSIAYGTAITLPEAPTKEGYTFSGWSEAPETMPTEDITISGTFTINKYLVTFKIGDEVIAADSLEYGATIVAPETPEREGHTFNGWGKVAETVPAEDVTISGTFTVNKYLVTFKIGDEVIAADSFEYGATIVAPEAPEKEGHTFNGWGEVAETVPAGDVTYEGSYTVNSYLLSYTIDGEAVQSDSIAYGTAITLPEAPTKEGYTFSGWSEAPETMPAEDVTISGTFTVNKYLVTFKIGDKVIAADSLEYGATIVAPEAPEREGHTFNGWGEVATVAPANDLIYEGSYSVNSYLLTYMVDGEAVQSDSIVYGTAITLPEAPTKEGYTFSGWSEAPETMPAEDVTISGTFTVNKYLVTFKIGDEVIAADSLEYGATIVAPEAPEREGHTFNGWGEVAETVPAHDVTYEGSYTVNIYKVYYYVGEELVHTAEVAYGEKIPEYIYEPTKEGDVLEGWTGEPYETMPAHDVTYTANITNGIEQLTNAKGQLTIYDLNGRKIEVEDLRELLRGIYIVNGHRVLLGD